MFEIWSKGLLVLVSQHASLLSELSPMLLLPFQNKKPSVELQSMQLPEGLLRPEVLFKRPISYLSAYNNQHDAQSTYDSSRV